MKKTLALLLAAALLLSCAACTGKVAPKQEGPIETTPAPGNSQQTDLPSGGASGGETTPGDEAGGADAAPAGTLYDTGSFSVFVPEGWTASAVPDIWAEEEGAIDPNSIRLIKGGSSDLDLFTHPYIQLDFHGEDSILWTPEKDWYDDGEDLEPTTLDGLTWKGFTATSLGAPLAVLWTEGEVIQYQANVFLSASQGEISLEDRDVRAILASVEPRDEGPSAQEGESAGKLNLIVDRTTGEMTVQRPSHDEIKPMGDRGVWTIFVYLCGTDLESDCGMASGDLLEMIAADGGDYRYVVETGGAYYWDSYMVDSDYDQRFLVQNGEIELVDQVPYANMGDGDTLAEFLEWGVENYASEHMGLIVWDHGGGSLSGVCFDERYGYDSISLRELDAALLRVFGGMTQKFDFFGFDACLMGTLEAANVLATYARYMVASQETEPGSGWDYTAIGDYLARYPAADALDVSRVACDSFLTACQAVEDDDLTTLSVVDLSRLDDLLLAFNDFSFALYSATEDETVRANVLRGIEGAKNFGGNNKTEGYTNMVDLGGIVSACADVGSNAAALEQALEDAVVYKVSGPVHSGASGLSVYYPLCVQGSGELAAFGEVCVSPYYLSFVDRQSQGGVNGGETEDYSDDQWYDEDDTWSWDTEIDESYWGYYDNFEVTGESPLITFEVEPILDDEGDYWFVLDEDGWYYAADVYGMVYELSYDGEDVIELGETYDIDSDWEYGFFCDDFDGWWLSLPDGQNLATYIVETTEDSIIYTSPVTLNGVDTNLRLRLNFEEQTMTIEGAWNGINENGAADREIIKLQEGDVIIPRYYSYNVDTWEEGEYVGWEYVVEGEPEIYYDVMETGLYLYAFCIDDIFGDYYLTDFVLFEVDEQGDVYFYPEED